jgi:hypothetical protein
MLRKEFLENVFLGMVVLGMVVPGMVVLGMVVLGTVGCRCSEKKTKMSKSVPVIHKRVDISALKINGFTLVNTPHLLFNAKALTS